VVVFKLSVKSIIERENALVLAFSSVLINRNRLFF
jgi:hypothetical protein